MEGDKQQQEAPAAPLHVVVFPWLAFGHLIPFIELSKRLARRGHAITFVTTPRNASRVRPAVPESLSVRVRVVALPLPAVDGLPEGAESTADVSPDKVGLLKAAFDGLAAPFADFLEAACGGDHRWGEREGGMAEKKPDWIVLDFAHHWLCPIADQHEVPCAMFVISTATMLAYDGPQRENIAHPRLTVDDFMPMPSWLPSSSLAFRRHEAAWIASAFRADVSGVSDIERIWRTEQRCRLLLFRSCPELEPQVFPVLVNLFGKPAVPAGLLLPDDSGVAAQSDAMQWLDEQPHGSVLYVALGSEAALTVQSVHEIALGLELAGVRFLWALSVTGAHLLPDGFEARTRGRGTVRIGWVPQVRVLAHAAVGAFLTHCGWGSVIESIRFGLPLVMLPFVVDQGLVARMMAERGVGVEVARRDDGGDGSFGRDDVAAAVSRVMVEEEGKQAFARGAKRLREMVVGDEGRRQQRYVDELVGCLRRHS